jgi:proteasome lid subunit RPN8/RPN11
VEVEVGAAICCDSKRCKLGPVSKGTPRRVVISLRCPPGMKPVGSWHSHPNNGDSYPSSADIKNLRKAGLNISCVSGRQGLKCFRIDKMP